MKPLSSTELHSVTANGGPQAPGDWALLAEVFDAAVAAAAWVDADLSFRWLNSRFSEWFPHGLVATGASDPWFKSGRGWEDLARLTLSEQRGQVDLLCQESAAGGRQSFRVTTAMWQEGVLFVLTDVTPERRLKEVLLQNQRLENLGSVAAGVAHDFNNVLAGILGVAALLQEGIPSSDPQHTLVDEIARVGSSATSLTRQILDFVRQGEEESVVVDLRDAAREVMDLLRRTIDPKVRIDFVVDSAPSAIRIDKGRVQQVLMNLCCNARDAMPAGGVLTVTVTRRGEVVTLRVRDTGMGMPRDLMERIFDPFFTTKEHGKGTGLGLAVCREIVTAAGGDMRVESTPGEGSLFEVHLPAVVDWVPSSDDPTNEEATRVESGRRILVVDDEPLVRMVAERFLRREGYEVVSVEDGDDALTVLRRGVPRIDLVILDLTMPGKSGPEVVVAARELLPELPILISSGYSEAAIENRGWALQVQGFLQKPYQRAALLGTVGRLLSTANV
ncbi:MAG: ATP-binding protein [Nitrospirota bacterium]|jgi:signal transduction histidine kinase